MAIFTGAGVAIVTPMHQDGTVNYDKLGELIEFQIANHTDSIIITGTTGEASTLSEEEHVECIRFAVSKVAGTSSGRSRNRFWLHGDSGISFTGSGKIWCGWCTSGEPILQ